MKLTTGIATTEPSSRSYKSSFPWLSLILPILVLIVSDAYLSFHPESDIEIALLLGILGLLWLFVLLIRITLALWHTLIKKALFLVLCFVCLWPAFSFLRWFHLGDYIHLAWSYPEYKSKIQASPNERMEFNWGGWGWAAGPSADRTLIYDPTDKVMMENRIKDSKLRAKSSYTRGKDTYYREQLFTWPLFDHFYLVELMHQA